MSKRLFLSCVSREFAPYRQLLLHDLTLPDVEVKVQEDFITGGGTTLEKLDHYIRLCDAVVHLIGDATGACPEPAAVQTLLARHPTLPAKLTPLAPLLTLADPGISYTQWEAWLAILHGKPCHIFSPEPAAPRDPRFVAVPAEQRSQQAHFDRLRALGRDRGTFADEQRLSVAVLRGLHDILPPEEGGAANHLHQLPSPAQLFGRDKVLGDLGAAIRTGGAASAAISGLQGMGGVGKTALAVALAHKVKDLYPDAQLMFNLRGYDPQGLAPRSAAEIMRDVILRFHRESKLPEDVQDLQPIYLSVLAQAGRVLLIYDNAADAAQVRPLLPPPGCLMLVTSRTHISLTGMVTKDLACLHPDESAGMLRTLAPRITGHEAEAAALCGHLPLKLEVFAATVRQRTVATVERLLGMLRQHHAEVSPEDAAFQVSYDLLPAAQQARLRALAVFSSSFDLRAAGAVWQLPATGDVEAAEQAMQDLVDVSLVEFSPAVQRFRLHDLMRSFCLRLLPAGETTALHLAHARHYVEVQTEAEVLYLKGDAVGGLALFDRERAQIEAAFAWLDKVVQGFSPQGSPTPK